MQEVPFHVLPVETRQQSHALWFVQTAMEIVWQAKVALRGSDSAETRHPKCSVLLFETEKLKSLHPSLSTGTKPLPKSKHHFSKCFGDSSQL